MNIWWWRYDVMMYDCWIWKFYSKIKKYKETCSSRSLIYTILMMFTLDITLDFIRRRYSWKYHIPMCQVLQISSSVWSGLLKRPFYRFWCKEENKKKYLCSIERPLRLWALLWVANINDWFFTPRQCLNPETVYYSFQISDYMVLMAAANTEIGVFTRGISV